MLRALSNKRDPKYVNDGISDRKRPTPESCRKYKRYRLSEGVYKKRISCGTRTDAMTKPLTWIPSAICVVDK